MLVAIDGFADADVIDVRGEHDVFILELGVAARISGDDVGRFHLCCCQLSFGLNGNSQGETRHRLAVFGQRGNFLEAVAGAGKKRHPLSPGLKYTASFSPAVSWNSASARSMLGRVRFSDMRDHGTSIEAGFGMRNHANRARCLERLPALGRRLVVR